MTRPEKGGVGIDDNSRARRYKNELDESEIDGDKVDGDKVGDNEIKKKV